MQAVSCYMVSVVILETRLSYVYTARLNYMIVVVMIVDNAIPYKYMHTCLLNVHKNHYNRIYAFMIILQY